MLSKNPLPLQGVLITHSNIGRKMVQRAPAQHRHTSSHCQVPSLVR